MDYPDGPVLSVLDDPDVMKADLLHVLGSSQGRRFVRRVFQDCGVFTAMPAHDPLLMASLEGKRQVGLALFDQVKACGANFITQLLQEDTNNV